MTCRWILHLDLDAFFAAIEQRDRPALRGQPVVVGAQPGGRGVVATCSYEARGFGIRSAMPIGAAVQRCPQAVFLRPRMAHYRAIAHQIRAVSQALVPCIEPISIDEAYLDITSLVGPAASPEVIGQHLKDAIRAAVGLTASVGIGPNRLIAKLASDYDKPDGLVVVTPDQVRAFLDPQPVGVLRGVGPRLRARLDALGLQTIADLRAYPIVALQAHLGSRAARDLHQQARGLASDQVGLRAPRQSISQETTFGQDVREPRILHDTLHSLALAVAATARAEGLAGQTVVLKIRLPGFETHSRQRRLPSATRDPARLLDTAWALYLAGPWRERPVRLLGLGLASLGPPVPEQADLFAPSSPDPARARRLADTIARIQARFGPAALMRGR